MKLIRTNLDTTYLFLCLTLSAAASNSRSTRGDLCLEAITANNPPTTIPMPEPLHDIERSWCQHLQSCFCYNIPDNQEAVEEAIAVYNCMKYLQAITSINTPSYLRELYLACNNNRHKLSREAKLLFMQLNFKDSAIGIVPKWSTLALAFFLLPKNVPYSQLAAIDFCERYPEKLQELYANEQDPTLISSKTLETLCRYQLHWNKETIAAHELQRLIALINSCTLVNKRSIKLKKCKDGITSLLGSQSCLCANSRLSEA